MLRAYLSALNVMVQNMNIMYTRKTATTFVPFLPNILKYSNINMTINQKNTKDIMIILCVEWYRYLN